MSADTIQNTSSTESGSQTESGPGMGGTSGEDKALAGGEEQTVEHHDSEGAEPKEQAGTEEESARRDDPKVDPEQYAAIQQQIADTEFIAKTIQNDPERMKAFEEWVRSDRGQPSSSGSVWDQTREAIETGFVPENREALVKFAEPLARRIDELEATIRSLRPQVERVSQVTASGEFSRGLVENGLPQNILSDKSFLAFLSQERRDRTFQQEERVNPRRAARNLANAWKATQGQRLANVNARQRNDDLKGGRLHVSPAPNGTGRQQVYVIDKSKPDAFTEALKIRQRHEERGLPPPKIEYRNGSK